MKKVIFGAVIVAIIGGLSYGVYTVKTKKPDDKMAGMPKDMPPLPVNVYGIKDSIETTTKSYPTIIKPSEEVNVIARVKGILKNKYFKEGDYVAKGTLLYTIEQDTYETNLNIATSAYEKAKVNLKKAGKDFERGKALLATKALSEQSYDNLEYAYDSAMVELKSSESNLKNAQIEYSYTKVQAPISGIVGMKKYDVGEFVGGSNDTSSLLTITNTDTIYAEFSLSKEDIKAYMNQIQNGSIGIKLVSGDTEYLNGKINFIAPKIDEATDTILVRASFVNKSHKIIAGEFAKIVLTNINLGNVNVVPENAILKNPKGTFVMVAVDGIVQMRPVETGILVQDGIVVKSGLAKGDKVIVSNIAKLRPDAKVMILPDDSKAKEVK